MSSTAGSDIFYDAPLSNGSVGVGLSNPQLGQGRRRMLDLVNKLHSTGVQVDIDLPQIAVIGAQSAGKSSLIESISGITLPRASGTCTRCPTECRLSHSNTLWQCVVSLRFITDARGQPLGQARNQPFGPVIYEKSEVEERIRRAQKAILNPSKPPRLFLEGDESMMNKTELTFSTNCVSLQISGPDVADLSFCDLPGLIASVSNNGSNADIDLVRNLIANYIKKPSCIILLTVACETDFENQGAHHLAKEYDPKGKRTIGVLTKPDRIPTGEEDNWIPYIHNEKEPLDNNWFCVKQPSSEELKTIRGWDEARRRENDWFSNTSPWCEMDSVYQKYLRTSNLVERLSSVLSDLISKRLPEIQDELDNAMVRTQGLIARLPRAPAADPRSAICTLLHEFTTDLARHVEGVPDDPDADNESGQGLIQAIRPTQERFRRAIRETAPNFRPFERKHATARHLGHASFLEDEEGFNIDGEASDDEEEKKPNVQPKRTDASAAPSSFKFGIPAKPSASSTARATQQKRENKIFIDEVMDRAMKARTRELPGHYPWVVQKTFIENIMKEWEAPALELCDIVYETLDQHVKKLVSKHFSEFGQGYLEQRVRAIMSNHLKTCLEDCQKQVLWLLKLESRPFSLNTHYLEAYRTKFITYYRAAREKYEQTDLIGRIKQYNKPANGAQSSQQAFSFATPPGGSPAPSGPNGFPPSTSPFVPLTSNNNLFPQNGAPAPSAFPQSTVAVHSAFPQSGGGAVQSVFPQSGGGAVQSAFPQSYTATATAASPPPPASPFGLTPSSSITRVLSGLAEIGLQGMKAEDLLRLLPSDPMEPALVIMADVRAYFQVAYKRFADNIPLAIDHELIQGSERGILMELYAGLGINGQDGQKICQELAMESPQVADRRMDLMNKYKRLQSAKRELLSIGL